MVALYGTVGIVLPSLHISLQKKETLTLFGRTVVMETKDQDVSHRGMVTSGC